MPESSTSITIDAPPDVVFAHLVDPLRMVRWMGQWADLNPVPGGGFAVDVNGVPFRGNYLEVDPPRRVVVSWGMAGSDDLPPGTPRGEFTLKPKAKGTLLELLHTGLPESRARTHGAGWAHYLARLQCVALGRDPGIDSFSPTEVRT